jgi:hypothetical protein
VTPALELARFLADNNLGPWGGATDFSVHVSREPASPDNVTTLYDTAGLAPLVVDGGDIRAPGVQVRVRCTDYEKGWKVQEDIRRLFLQPNAAEAGDPLERTIGAHRYLTITPVADILSIGRDDNDRHLLVANYQLIRQAVETAT